MRRRAWQRDNREWRRVIGYSRRLESAALGHTEPGLDEVCFVRVALGGVQLLRFGGEFRGTFLDANGVDTRRLATTWPKTHARV